jgi:phosphopantothenoylcysteine decarboxylase/phosphopantothenate--cysteine ligase
LDLIAVNNVLEPGSGFEVDTNRLTLLYADGRIEELPLMSKRACAERIIEVVAEHLRQARRE